MANNKQCRALTDWLNEEQCSRQAKIEIDGVGYCIPHAAKICLQWCIKEGVVKPINKEDWFYKRIINKVVKIKE